MEVINPAPQPDETQSSATYQSAPVFQPQETPKSPVISIGDWFITVLLLAIPLVNLIMLLVWAFGGNTNPSKANFAKANLIWMAIAILLSLFFFSSLMALFMALR